MRRLATLPPVERENDEADRLVRPAPKQRPPRRDRRRERMDAEKDPDTDSDPDLKGKDTSLNYKTIGGSTRVALRYLSGAGEPPSGPPSNPPPGNEPPKRKQKEIPARNKETGKKVYITPDAFKASPGKYEKWTDTDDATSEPARGIKPQFQVPRPGKKPIADPGKQTVKLTDPPAADDDEYLDVDPENEEPKGKGQGKGKAPKEPKEPKEPKPSKEEKEKAKKEKAEKAEKAEKEKAEKAAKEKAERIPTVGETHGIPKPKQREVSASERAETTLLLVDHLPAKLAAKLIVSRIHPDDAKELIGSYKAATSRPIGNPAQFAEKVSKIYETDPDRIEPPASWRTSDGETLSFKEMAPEDQASVYRKHQLQVLAMSFAAEHQLHKALSFGGKVPEAVAQIMTSALLGGGKPKAAKPVAKPPEKAPENEPAKAPEKEPGKSPPEDETSPAPKGKESEPAKTEPAKSEPAKTDPTKTEPAKSEPAKEAPKKGPSKEEQAAAEKAARVGKVVEAIFDHTAEAGKHTRITEGQAKQMLAAVAGNDAAVSMVQSFLEGNDYVRAKDMYLKKSMFTELDKPDEIAEGLRSARDYFDRQGKIYGKAGHEGAKRFETKTLQRLRTLDGKKYQAVRAKLDKQDAKAYDKANAPWDAFDKAHTAWAKAAKPDPKAEPKSPKGTRPVQPAGYSNAMSPVDLKDAGHQLWDDMFARADNTKTAARVAAKTLISSYLSRMTMDRGSKRALYHGIAPGEHYPRERYPRWSPVPSRDLAETDYVAILVAAKAWLEPSQAKGAAPDQRFRAALDLALSSGKYRVDIQAYSVLLARLQGVEEPGLVKYAVDRDKLERAVYARFPPDSKRRAGSHLTVMLTGDTAAKLRKPEFAMVQLAELSDSELLTLASTMRVPMKSRTGRSSSFSPAHHVTHSNPITGKTDNGARHMLRLSTQQKTSANRILASFDDLAQVIQDNHAKWGMSREAAKKLVNHLDRTADETEALIFGEDSLHTRQAEVAVQSKDFTQDVLSEGLISRRLLAKAAKVLQRDADEPYMDTFKNPMAPIETDSDEPYMSAYGDDQSTSVFEGEDESGRQLAP